MYILMIIVFIVGYLAIAFEHNLKIDKAAPALMTGAIMWTVLIIGVEFIIPGQGYKFINKELYCEVKENCQNCRNNKLSWNYC